MNQFSKMFGRSVSIFINYPLRRFKSIDKRVVQPFIDLDFTLRNKQALLDSLFKRGVTEDVDSLESEWCNYKKLVKRQSELELRREEISNALKSGTGEESLRSEGKLTREEYKNVLLQIRGCEVGLLPRILNLPNVLHRCTDNCEGTILKSHLEPRNSVHHHLNVGKELDLIDYKSIWMYYLKGNAALYEFGITQDISNALMKHDFVNISNMDFARSPLANWFNEDLLALETSNRSDMPDILYLPGTAHIIPFFALLTKMICPLEDAPIKWFSIGRQYSPCKSKFDGLYSVIQKQSVQIFIASIDNNFDDVVDQLWLYYQQLGLPMRLVTVPVKELSNAEAQQVSIQIYSGFNNAFVNVATFSNYGDYLSQRLRAYIDNNGRKEFAKVMSGNVCNVPHLLALILEHGPEYSMDIISSHLQLFSLSCLD